jgi:hypothetical protein
MVSILFYVLDGIVSLLLAIPFLNPFVYINSRVFTNTETYILTAWASLFLLIWLPWRGWKISLRIVVWGWLLAACINSIIGLLQYFGVTDVTGIASVPLGVASGNVRQTNLLATLQVIGLLALFWLWRSNALPFRSKVLNNGLVALLAVIVLTGLAATASRIGMVELASAALLMLYYGWNQTSAENNVLPRRLVMRRAAMITIIGLIFYAAIAILLPLFLHDTEGSQGRNLIDRWAHAENSCNSRFTLYSNVLQLISLKPWTGWGWGNLAWANFVTIYDDRRMCSPWLDNAHNLPLHLAVTLGIPAALVICGAIFYVIWRSRPWRETSPNRQLAWGVLLMIALHSLVEYPLWYGPFQVAVVICVALLWTTRPTALTMKGIVPHTHRAPWLCSGLAAVMLAAAGYATWDYWRISQLFVPVTMRAPQWREDPIAPASKSWLFAGYVRLALVLGTPVTRENAAQMLPMAILATHVGPMSDVIGKIVESSAMLGHNDLALAYLKRFQLAMPKEYQEWAAQHASLVEQLQSGGPKAKPP